MERCNESEFKPIFVNYQIIIKKEAQKESDILFFVISRKSPNSVPSDFGQLSSKDNKSETRTDGTVIPKLHTAQCSYSCHRWSHCLIWQKRLFDPASKILIHQLQNNSFTQGSRLLPPMWEIPAGDHSASPSIIKKVLKDSLDGGKHIWLHLRIENGSGMRWYAGISFSLLGVENVTFTIIPNFSWQISKIFKKWKPNSLFLNLFWIYGILRHRKKIYGSFDRIVHMWTHTHIF